MDQYSQPFLRPHEAVIVTKYWKIQHTICFGITILMFSYIFFLQVSLETLETTHGVIKSFIMQTPKRASDCILETESYCTDWKHLTVQNLVVKCYQICDAIG